MQQSRTITRNSASNLALAFVLLPKPKRDAMSALYAFCREVDDVADDESVSAEQRRTQLAAWREDLRQTCEGGQSEFAVNRELQPVIRQFGLPFASFDDIIKGCEMDLEKKRYEDFTELSLYCYRVASAVGLLSIRIFEFKNPACTDYATHLGHALQLTNILRDVREDAGRDRIYLPLCELKRFGVTEAQILRGEYSSRYRNLAASAAEKARDHYRLACELLPAEDRRAMVAAELMGSVYWRLLCKLEQQNFDVFGPQPTRLSKPQKFALILRSWVRFVIGATSPNYGPI
jgi:15-cis-phytoene synthase